MQGPTHAPGPLVVVQVKPVGQPAPLLQPTVHRPVSQAAGVPSGPQRSPSLAFGSQAVFRPVFCATQYFLPSGQGPLQSKPVAQAPLLVQSARHTPAPVDEVQARSDGQPAPALQAAAQTPSSQADAAPSGPQWPVPVQTASSPSLLAMQAFALVPYQRRLQTVLPGQVCAPLQSGRQTPAPLSVLQMAPGAQPAPSAHEARQMPSSQSAFAPRGPQAAPWAVQVDSNP